MRISPSRLPRLLGVLVIAFAHFEDRPLLGAVELFRGLSMQLAYRWATGQIMAAADDRAVLLWSVAFRSEERRALALEVFGASMATLVGLALVVITSAILLLPLGLVAFFTDQHGLLFVKIGLAIIIARWLMTTWRAISAYRSELALLARLPDPKVLRWRIDFLGALPARRGHGGLLLGEFLAEADDCTAEVVLHCQKRNVAFYRHYGFREADVAAAGAQRVMVRRLRTTKRGGRHRFNLSGNSKSTRRQPVSR
jgi:hypothetical protein